MITAPGPTLWARLPAGGWQVGFSVDTAGRRLIDIADSLGSRAYCLASARQAALSVDAAWVGGARGPGTRQCWALAVGCAPTGLQPVVTFILMTGGAGSDQVSLPATDPSGFWVANGGLWVAAAAGYYTHVRLAVPDEELLHPLHPVTS